MHQGKVFHYIRPESIKIERGYFERLPVYQTKADSAFVEDFTSRNGFIKRNVPVLLNQIIELVVRLFIFR
jgi:hypothetical protein